MPLTIQEVRTPEDVARWDAFVLAHPRATGYHLMAWRKIITEVFGHRTVYLFVEDDDGRIRGILPLCVLSSRLFGTFVVSLPAVNYGGALAEDRITLALLLDAASVVARDSGAKHAELRQQHQLEADWLRKQNKVSMRLVLPSSYETLWASYPSKLRSQIRRAQKEGMTTEIGGPDLLDDFYGVFARNMRDLGTPVYGKRFFEEVLLAFPKDARICVVKLRGKAIAVGFLYGFRNMLEIPWASSDRRYAKFAPNMLLYSSVLKHACEQGYHDFDFGRSSKDSGTYRFKEQWGAQPVQLEWYYWLRDRQQLPELNPQNPKFRLAIEIWKRLPLPLATLMGPPISRGLP